jgi:hypothetical protein
LVLEINFLLWLNLSVEFFQFQHLQLLLDAIGQILDLFTNKLCTRLNNDRVKKLVALYQNLIQKEINEDIWFEDDEN